ncbi:MAG: hypothetical protein WC836_05825 [Desulfobacula sp.]|jgi:hypothetical protein
MKKNTTTPAEHHCTVLEQKHLVSEMTACDRIFNSYDKKYECYLDATRESRENKACMYS